MLKSMKIELPETIPLNTVSDRKQKQMLRESRNHLQYLKDESRITVNTQAIFANAYKEKVKLEKIMRIQRNNQILTNISMLFILQFGLCMSMLSYFFTKGFEDPVEFTFVVIGFICVILSHLAMQPRILASIERIKYVYHHQECFDNILLPLVVCYMKFLIEVTVELLNIFTTYFITDQLYVVMCFSALLVISYVDQQYYETIEHPLKTKLENEAEYQLPILSSAIEKKEWDQMRGVSKAGYRAINLLKFIYE